MNFTSQFIFDNLPTLQAWKEMDILRITVIVVTLVTIFLRASRGTTTNVSEQNKIKFTIMQEVLDFKAKVGFSACIVDYSNVLTRLVLSH